MYSPLVIDDTIVGIIAFANKRSGFSDNDANIAKGFGELCSIALKNQRLQEKRNQDKQEKQKLIEELTQALENVKTLSGLVPICQHCKKNKG